MSGHGRASMGYSHHAGMRHGWRSDPCATRSSLLTGPSPANRAPEFRRVPPTHTAVSPEVAKARSPTCNTTTMDDGKLPYDPAMIGLDNHRAKGPVSMRRRGEYGKARCGRGETPGNCCGAALLIPTITTTHPPQPLPHHTRTFECIFCLHPDSGTGIAPEAEARAYLRKRVRVQ